MAKDPSLSGTLFIKSFLFSHEMAPKANKPRQAGCWVLSHCPGLMGVPGTALPGAPARSGQALPLAHTRVRAGSAPTWLPDLCTPRPTRDSLWNVPHRFINIFPNQTTLPWKLLFTDSRGSQPRINTPAHLEPRHVVTNVSMNEIDSSCNFSFGGYGCTKEPAISSSVALEQQRVPHQDS